MSKRGRWLVTGISGYIGGALLKPLAAKYDVIGITRKRVDADVPVIRGEFSSFEDLRQLDKYEIQGLVHLAAATGGCSEEDGLGVNVQGTRRLLRYLIDRGCRKFVMASSVAAVGCLNADFLPLELPISDDHPCLAVDAYGFSKAMMEELIHFLHRVHPDADFINLRFGAVLPQKNIPSRYDSKSHLDGPMIELARVHLDNVLASIMAAVESHQPGVRTYNVVDPKSYCDDPVLDILKPFYGHRLDGIDVSFFTQSEHKFDAIYTINKVQQELGFTLQQYESPGMGE